MRDLTPGHYVLPNLDELEQSDEAILGITRLTSDATYTDDIAHIAQLPTPDNDARNEQGSARHNSVMSEEASPEMRNQMRKQAAVLAERRRIEEILEKRPVRMEEGLWKEVWSFVVVNEKDKVPKRKARRRVKETLPDV